MIVNPNLSQQFAFNNLLKYLVNVVLKKKKIVKLKKYSEYSNNSF